MTRDEAEQVLRFLDRIEGAGYGGMAEFEIARETMRRAAAAPSCEHCKTTPAEHETFCGWMCSACLSMTMDM